MTLRSFFGMSMVASLIWVASCGDDPAPNSPTNPPVPQPLTLSAPVAVSPSDGGVVNSRTPTLMLRASAGNDPSAAVSYEIEVLTSSGQTAHTATVAGGAANGQATVSYVVSAQLARWTSYRWRARAVATSATSAWSDATSSPATFVTTRPDATTSNEEFREFFFDLIDKKSVGSTSTAEALTLMEPELTAAGVILAKALGGSPRGRLYLPTGGVDKYTRSVDVVTGFGPGYTWVWIFRGRTVCEFICP